MQVSYHYYHFDIDRKSIMRSTVEGSTAERPLAKGSSAKGSRSRLKVHWYAVKFSSPPLRLF